MTDWKQRFSSTGAVYERPDTPNAPHIDTLKSDTHSTAYFHSDYIAQDPDLLAGVSREWAMILEANNLVPDRVLGHAPFAEAPALMLAYALRRAGHDTLFAYSRLRSKGVYQTDFPIRPGEKIVVVADDVVSGASTIETARDAAEKGAVILPVIPCLANLSLQRTLDLGAGAEEAHLLAASTFEPVRYRTREAPCQLCRDVGSVALAPRQEDNWQILQSWMQRA